MWPWVIVTYYSVRTKDSFVTKFEVNYIAYLDAFIAGKCVATWPEPLNLTRYISRATCQSSAVKTASVWPVVFSALAPFPAICD